MYEEESEPEADERNTDDWPEEEKEEGEKRLFGTVIPSFSDRGFSSFISCPRAFMFVLSGDEWQLGLYHLLTTSEASQALYALGLPGIEYCKRCRFPVVEHELFQTDVWFWVSERILTGPRWLMRVRVLDYFRLHHRRDCQAVMS